MTITELEVVNEMMDAIGSPSVNTLTGTLSEDVSMAKRLLDSVRKEVLMETWNFNKEHEVPLSPDSTTGSITLDSDVLSVDVTPGYNTDVDVIQRGNKLYDRENRTYVFEDDLTVDLVRDLEWSLLPEPAKNYVKIKALRRFLDQQDPDQRSHAYTVQDEVRARVTLHRSETANADKTIFDSHSAAQGIKTRVRPNLYR